ncbi:MAG: V-type ATP synthase subunit F, partial [Firmicutes bacterium]|nr:V-type ATP synthase subunit F [Bacillota bacterium]
ALGLEVYPIEDGKEASKTLRRLAESGFAIIYLTEALGAKIAPEIESYRLQKLPAIILIPGVSGNTGNGMLNVKKLVEQAVGSDIIFDNNK